MSLVRYADRKNRGSGLVVDEEGYYPGTAQAFAVEYPQRPLFIMHTQSPEPK